jgi:hypothetical protein
VWPLGDVYELAPACAPLPHPLPLLALACEKLPPYRPDAENECPQPQASAFAGISATADKPARMTAIGFLFMSGFLLD